VPIDMIKLRALQPPDGLPFKIRRLGHVVLQVPDLGRSLLFYTQALGSRLAPVVMSGRRANGTESERLKRRSPIR